MFARAEQLGVAGKYIAFMKQIVEEAQKHGSDPVDLDMLGATGATMMDLGFSPEAAWAIAAVTRTFAAGAHAIEEIERGKYTQLGQTLTPKEDYDGPDDRPVPPPDKRDKVAKPAIQGGRLQILEACRVPSTGSKHRRLRVRSRVLPFPLP
jgi:citrate synthase